MIGKKMLLYDKANDAFFAGYKVKNGKTLPTWVKDDGGALVINQVDVAVQYKDELGLGVRIVTEEEADEIKTKRVRNAINALMGHDYGRKET